MRLSMAGYTFDYDIPTPYTFSGHCYDHLGAPCAREVRIYRVFGGKLAGGITSGATDGAFAIPVAFNDEHFAVAFDADGSPDLNALILAKVFPV
jgi:hypothetical protein